MEASTKAATSAKLAEAKANNAANANNNPQSKSAKKRQKRKAKKQQQASEAGSHVLVYSMLAHFFFDARTVMIETMNGMLMK